MVVRFRIRFEIKSNLSETDIRCEEYFQNTHFRDKTGRYVPFKENMSCWGDSRDLALQRFIKLERKLVKSPGIYKLYKKIMQEYLDLKHMELVNNFECQNICYYTSHHHVMKESSTTNKLRLYLTHSLNHHLGFL